MAILTNSARIVLAQYILTCPIFLAIGEGKQSWDSNPDGIPDPPDYDAVGLIKTLGWKKLTRSFFVVQDDDGDIDMPGGLKYKQSNVPTRDIYMHFVFNYGEGEKQTIREAGVFINTQVNLGLPSKQTYFKPEEISRQGTLLLLEHLDDPDNFTPNKKGSYGTILTI